MLGRPLKDERAPVIKYQELVNTTTGELFNAYSKLETRQRSAKPKSPFTNEGLIFMSQAALKTIRNDKRIRKHATTMLVFLDLLGRLDFQNELLISQTAIAKELELTRPQVSRAIRTLCERHTSPQGDTHGPYLLVGDKKQGTCKSYRLNPQIAWKGEAKTHRKALQEMRADNVIPLFAEAEQGE